MDLDNERILLEESRLFCEHSFQVQKKLSKTLKRLKIFLYLENVVQLFFYILKYKYPQYECRFFADIKFET